MSDSFPRSILAHYDTDSDDLYLAEIGQTQTPSWACGRIVLLGDTAFCSSALTGMGTTAAIVGAYILAAELVRNPTNPRQAFAAHEHHLRPWIEKIQQLPIGLLSLSHPSSKVGALCPFICKAPWCIQSSFEDLPIHSSDLTSSSVYV